MDGNNEVRQMQWRLISETENLFTFSLEETAAAVIQISAECLRDAVQLLRRVIKEEAEIYVE